MEDNRDASLCALFPVAEAGHTVLGPSVQRRKRRTLEDPVKNGASFNDF